MVNWIYVAALFAVAAAKPQSYIVGPGHFHYEFGGQNEYKFAKPTPAPVVTKTVAVSTPAPVVTPIVKNIEYQVNPVTYRTPVTVRPVTQTVSVSQVPVQEYVSTYPYNQYGAQYNTQRYVSQPVTVTQVKKVVVPQVQKVVVPQVQQITVPVSTVRSQPVVPSVTVQQQNVPQVYSTQVQSGHNYGGYAILRYIFDVKPYGGYNYAYETENGIKAEESGESKNAGTQDEAEVAQGYYSYTGPDGVVYTVRYIADENGFRAEGDHLPKIPEAIQRALEYLKTLPPKPDEQK